jgi:hypothetical protein
MLVRPRGPESDALNAAVAATAQFVQSIGTQREDYTRHAAALSLYDAWTKLVALQPKSSSQSPALNQLALRTANCIGCSYATLLQSILVRPLTPSTAAPLPSLLKPGLKTRRMQLLRLRSDITVFENPSMRA